MNEDELREQLKYSMLLVWLVALLISLPLVVSAVYNFARPREAYVNDRQLLGYESWRIEMLERLSEREGRELELHDEEKTRERYAAVEREHDEAARADAGRRLLMYGVLMLISSCALGYRLYSWRRLRT